MDRSVGGAYGCRRPDDDDLAAVPLRMTFLIRPDQSVEKVYAVSNVQDHPQEVLDDLRAAAG